MTVVALTGGIGAGKSQAAEYFASFGALVIDADQLARMVIERGTPGFDAVVQSFGDEILTNGNIDRARLADIVFADPSARAKLEAIIHPAIRERFKAAVADLGADEILIYEIPLLVETGSRENFDFIITVEADEEKRHERLISRGMRISEIERRIAAQARPDERRAIADAIIENNGTQDELLRECELIWERLKG